MARRTYTPEERANALVHLQMNGGDVMYTAQQLRIPDRTLFDWRRKWYEENPPPRASPRTTQPPEFEDEMEALAYLRKQILGELLNMADTFRQDAMFATPGQRINLLSRLLDRLMKLDTYIKLDDADATEYIRVSASPGLYLHTEEAYFGPFTPPELPADWKERYGPSARLEYYWGDDTFSPLPDDEGFLASFLNVQEYDAEPNIVSAPWSDDFS